MIDQSTTHTGLLPAALSCLINISRSLAFCTDVLTFGSEIKLSPSIFLAYENTVFSSLFAAHFKSHLFTRSATVDTKDQSISSGSCLADDIRFSANFLSSGLLTLNHMNFNAASVGLRPVVASALIRVLRFSCSFSLFLNDAGTSEVIRVAKSKSTHVTGSTNHAVCDPDGVGLSGL